MAFASEQQIHFTQVVSSSMTAGVMSGSANREKINLERAVRDHYKQVYRFAYHLTHHAEDAADLTQFAYEKLTEKHHEIRDASKVKAWLQSIVYRKFVDQRRRVIRFPQVEYNEELGGAEGSQHDAPDKLDGSTAMEAMKSLDSELQAPLALFYLESHSYKQIAELLSLPVGTVMSRLYRGKKKLYQVLTGESS